MSKPDSEFADVEILSPGGKNSEPANTPRVDPLFAVIARLMDTWFSIPGTNIRFGLDPILGLIPGLGDTSGAIISGVLIFRGAQAGLPRIVLARMALNVLLNTVIGCIPVLGDVFSVWFKSNQRNYALFQKNLAAPSISHRTDWTFVIVLLIALLLTVGIFLAISFTLLTALWQFAWGK